MEVLQDCQSTFEFKEVGKRQKDILDIVQKIIYMYAKGMTTCQIQGTIEDIYLLKFFGKFHLLCVSEGARF